MGLYGCVGMYRCMGVYSFILLLLSICMLCIRPIEKHPHTCALAHMWEYTQFDAHITPLIHVHKCTYTRTNTYTHTHTHAYVHTYTHT